MGAIGIWENVWAFTDLHPRQSGRWRDFSQNTFQVTSSGAILDESFILRIDEHVMHVHTELLLADTTPSGFNFKLWQKADLISG